MDVATDLGIQQVLERSVGVKVPAEQLSGVGNGIHNASSRTIGEQNRSTAVAPIDDSRQGVGADDQDSLRAESQETVGHSECVNETRTHRIHIKSSAPQPKFILNRCRGSGQRSIWSGGGEDEAIDCCWVDVRHGNRPTCGCHRK